MMGMGQSTIQNKLRHIIDNYQDNIAIESGTTQLTYSDIGRRSDRVANYLLSKGIKKETFIGVMMDSKIGFIITMLGIIKARCVFVPMDSDHPDERIKSMMNKCDMTMMITDQVKYSQQFSIVNNVVYKDIMDGDSENSVNTEDMEYSPLDRIYVYFTSGTTGEPKAILGKNESVLQFIKWETEAFEINEKSRISQFTTIGFDAFLRDVFLPLLNGGTLCIPQDNDIILKEDKLKQWIEDERIELIHCVPSLFQLIQNQCDGYEFESLKYILLSGERLRPTLLKPWFAKYNNRIKIVNLYGATETTMIRTMHVVTESDLGKERIPIGKPIKGSRVVILDEGMQPCKIGVVGELYIRTPYSTYGYFNDPTLTREKFIPNPFNNNPEDLIYKTGDLGQLLPDQTIDLLGRIDRKVKIRGNLIELEEVENILRPHSMLDEIVVIKKETPAGQGLLVAFVITNAGEIIAFDKVRKTLDEYAMEKMPSYMIPQDYIQLDQIPRKSNGKIDYTELEKEYEKAVQESVPPSTELEVRIADVWERVLNHKIVSIKESFFKLGGSSLNMLKLVSEMHKEYDIRLSIGEFFNNNTIEMQAKLIQGIINQSGADKEEGADYAGMDHMIVNNNKEQTIFVFPPIYAYGFPYLELAKEVNSHNFCIFNFLVGDDKMSKYAEYITQIQSEGPYLFLGYSAGGNLAHEVAKHMNENGKEVSNIIMLDAQFREASMMISDDEIDLRVQYILDMLEEVQHSSDLVENEVKEIVRRSYAYHKELITQGEISADIHYVLAENSDHAELIEGWNAVTKGIFKTYQGLEAHNEMLSNKKNYTIIKEILEAIARGSAVHEECENDSSAC